MRRNRFCIFFYTFALCLALSSFATGEIKITGETIQDLKIDVEFKDVDKSTAKSSARAFLDYYYSIQNPVYEVQIDEIYTRSLKKFITPVMTKEYAANFIDYEKRKISRDKKRIEKEKRSIQFNFKNEKKLDDGSLLLEFTMTRTTIRNCAFCKGTGMRRGKKCPLKSCENGKRIKKKEGKGRIAMVKNGDEWRVRDTFTKCYSCRGSGKCKRCKKTQKPGAKAVPGQKSRPCYNCKDTGVCGRCDGTGFRPRKVFTRSTTTYTGLPALEVPKVDLSSPEAAFKSFEKAGSVAHSLRYHLKNKLAKAFESLIQTFADKSSKIAASTRKYWQRVYEKTKVEDGEKGSKIFHFQIRRKGMKYTIAKKQLKLVQGDDGKWKVALIYKKCYRCKGKGKAPGRSTYHCSEHGKVRPNYTKAGAVCSKCQKKMKRQRGELGKCNLCHGTGMRSVKRRYNAF